MKAKACIGAMNAIASEKNKIKYLQRALTAEIDFKLSARKPATWKGVWSIRDEVNRWYQVVRKGVVGIELAENGFMIFWNHIEKGLKAAQKKAEQKQEEARS